MTDFLGYIEAGSQAYAEGQYAQGGKIFLTALREARRVNLKDASLTIILHQLAHFYYHQKKYKKAAVCLGKALIHCESLSGRNTTQVSQLLKRLAEIYELDHRYERAEAMYKRSMQIDQRLHLTNNTELAQQMLKLAWLNSMQRNFDQAQYYLEEALKLKTSLTGGTTSIHKFAQNQLAQKIANKQSLQLDTLSDDLLNVV